MKTSVIVCLALVLVGCGASPKRASLTATQAAKLAMRELPAPATNSGYVTLLAEGYWHVVVVPVTEQNGGFSFSEPTNLLHTVATVRDSDGKVEVVR